MSTTTLPRTPSPVWAEVAVVPAQLVGWALAVVSVLVQFVLLTALLLVVLLAPLAVLGAMVVSGLS